MEIYNPRTLDEITRNGGPLFYKDCRDLEIALREGDNLEFKVGGVKKAHFQVQGLPLPVVSPLLLLIPRRRGRGGFSSMVFESHVFAAGEEHSAQVAVIDASKWSSDRGGGDAGHGISSIHIAEHHEVPDKNRTTDDTRKSFRKGEKLAFGAVASVRAPGNYDISLPSLRHRSSPSSSSPGRPKEEEAPVFSSRQVELHARARGNYVVLRVGEENNPDGRFPQELVVFPASSAYPGAGRRRGSFFVALVLSSSAAALSLSLL